MKKLSEKSDLTRWNRAGLKKFRYVDANAITLLETLRQGMVEAYTESGENAWQALETRFEISSQETVQQRQDRWVKQYQDERRDYAWEILRSYARASHVLAEHIDAFANESYIGTASQWNNIRRLVEMLDYHPAPAASAQTSIAILAKEHQSGTLEAGFSFKNKPLDGSKPAIYETLEDVEVDYQLNKLKSANWDQSQIDFIYPADGQHIVFPIAQAVEKVSIGTYGILLVSDNLGNDQGVEVTVSAIDANTITLNGPSRPDDFPAVITRYQARLLLKAKFKQSPQLHGSNVVTLNSDHQLTPNMKLAYQSGANYIAATVLAVQGDKAKLSRAIPSAGTQFFLAARSDAREVEGVADTSKRVILPLTDNRENNALFDQNLNLISGPEKQRVGGIDAYEYFDGSVYSSVYYLPKTSDQQADVIGIVKANNAADLVFDGEATDIASADWVLAQSADGLQALTINTLDEQENNYTLTFSKSTSDLSILFANFEFDLRCDDYNANRQPIFLTQLSKRSNSHSVIPLESVNQSALLTIGRKLIISGKDHAMEVTVKDIDPSVNEIKVAPAIPGSELTADGTSLDYTRYDTVIYANTAFSGHGETQKEQFLGSGDATQSNQTFDFEVSDVSFESNREFPAGVRCAINIMVQGRTWQQVSNINDSSLEDPHYVVRMKEDGSLKLIFGDGIHGRRLPTGNNNVKIIHKVGVGLSGNLPAFSLQKEVKPHYLVEKVVQPLVSSGGNDSEASESLRQNAPASVLTLERAVSLSDFTHLSTSNSSVWQARAFQVQAPRSRNEQIHVAVVPAGGGSLGSLEQDLASFLTAHALPGVAIKIIPYEPLIFDLNITIRIDTNAFDPDFVAHEVEQQLLDKFSLSQRNLGEPLYRSQLFALVESVQGVANCQCEIVDNSFKDASGVALPMPYVAKSVNGAVKRVSAKIQQLIYIDKLVSNIKIVTQSFSL
jgi:hypothetical protein